MEGPRARPKRPPAGIWGGLWSLPQSPLDEADWQSALGRYSTKRKGRLLPERRHTFSHYHLDFTPIVINEAGGGVADSEARWFLPEEALALGLPAPVRQLLLDTIDDLPEWQR